ncbi:hypothetical protein HOD30_05205 [Candidatus Peregrinibacteria bacterium]|jgi:hypothetical protein|nr:hypothetical protein [Candidatus Peregrinibacteria bacterium]MBT4631419.1 hypothetical protein [Candidatus Peregrinibacteria bacterium]MBT5516928.1 hypothetical protein [Candidatus Peregrinibacteria bacterium]MBT5823996.1 hypothetical protein [Candidatus Peregrinibacteria bacterium]
MALDDNDDEFHIDQLRTLSQKAEALLTSPPARIALVVTLVAALALSVSDCGNDDSHDYAATQTADSND